MFLGVCLSSPAAGDADPLAAGSLTVKDTAMITELWDEVFRAGTHTSAEGVTREFSAADLDKIVTSYNPLIHTAPLVIGHPASTTAPAFGWVDAIKRVGDSLFVKYKDMSSEFADWVKRGLYKKKSIKLAPDLSLVHVGYLGAVPPAVRGLKDISLAGGADGMSFEFANNNQPDGGVVMEKDLELLNAKNVELEGKISSFSVKLDAITAENAALKTENGTLRNHLDRISAEQVAAAKREQRRGFESFCDGLIREGKLAPAAREGTLLTMESLAGSGEVSFADGTKKSALVVYQDTLKAQPKILTTTEFATSGAACGVTGNAGVQLEALVKAKMTADKDLSYSSAFVQVCKEHPELEREYSTEVSGH